VRLVRCYSGCFEILFVCLLYGAGRFICLLAVYAFLVDGSPSIISAALIEVKIGQKCHGIYMLQVHKTTIMTLRIKWRQAITTAEEVRTLGERATMDALYVYCLLVCNLVRISHKTLCRNYNVQ
jgi:hypothetical protein